MSDTPRTDAAYSASTGAGIYELFKEAQDLERELAAAKERISRLEKHAHRLEVFGDVLDDLIEVPSPNCSCHISPPCNDCVENGEFRFAKLEWKQAKEAKP